MTYSNLVDAAGLEYFFDQIYLKYLQWIGTCVQQESGKGLSTNDYTTAEKNKLSGIATGAQVNVIESVKVNGSALTITNKAVDITVPSLSGYATETWVSNKLNDILGINASGVSTLAAVLADSDLTTGILSAISAKADSSSLATVATSGSYNDLSDKPTIPSEYVLPIASASTLGGIKIGTGFQMNSETGVLNAIGTANVLSDWAVTDSASDAYIKNKPTNIATIGDGDGTAVIAEKAIFTLSSTPTSSTLTHTSYGVTYTYLVGDEVRVADSTLGNSSTDNYIFYKLYDLNNNTAYWAPISKPVSDVFTSSSYYTKTDIDNAGYLTQHQDISGKANSADLATVATSGSYNDLTDKPTLFSGSYNELTNKPTIPTVPTNVSSFTNDAGYTTNTGTVTKVKVGSTDYNPVSGVISLPAYPTTLPASDVSSWAKASSKPSYTYSEISGTPTIPTKVSQLTNDSGFTTNTGTVTQVKVGSNAYNPSSGIVSLPAYPTSLPASDVSSWAKASSKPSYSLSEVGVSMSASAITANTSSSCSITGSGNAGKAQTIVYTNSSGADLTVTVPTTYATPDGAAIELTCPNGGYCEVSYINIGGTIYARGL